MIPVTVFGVRFVFGVSVNVSFWTPVAVCGCNVVVGVNNRLFLPLSFGVIDGEKLTRLAVAGADVDSLFLLLLFIIDCGNSNVFSDFRLAALAFVFTRCSECSLISKA